MILEEKEIILKNGKKAVLKSPCAEDAKQLLEFIRTACRETDFLLRYEEEWTISVEQEAAWVEQQRASSDVLGIACYVNGEVAGNCEIRFLGGMKTAHRAVVSIALLKKYWSLGIGSAMFKELIEAGCTHGTEILELEFIEGNERARHLYEKFGFHIVAEKPKAFKLKDGSYRSEFSMQKYLNS